MDEEIARLRRQLEEERNRREEADRRLEETERQLERHTLWGLLEGCHNLLSKAIRVEKKVTLTTQGDTTNPVNRLYPKQILPWDDFPNLQEKVWEKLHSELVFTSQRLFASDTQLEYVRSNIRRPIYSERSLQNFQRDTVDNFVENIIDALSQDENLRSRFHIKGRVTFDDRANTETSTDTLLEDAMGQLHVDNPPLRSRPQTRGRGGQRAGNNIQGTRPARRRNRRADQFCVHVVADERRTPAYAVEFKAPHKLTVAELAVGLHEIEPARDVIDKDGETFEFWATYLVTTVITQLFSYMIDSGVQYGYICTGEAYVFLHIPDDPTRVYYHLCVPNQDVLPDEECRLHRTALGQVLAFALNALSAEPPSQEWHDAADEKLSTWEVEYIDVLKDIPPTVRKDPFFSPYKSSWKTVQRTPYNTRSRARCQSGRATPERSLGESSGSDDNLPSPSPATFTRSGPSRGGRGDDGRGGRDTRRSGQSDSAKTHSAGFRDAARVGRQYCTMDCIRGLVNRGRLDPRCPNFQEHGTESHSLGPREFIRRLHKQLLQDRSDGFEQLHIRGRTGYLIKASLLSHGYVVVIKATTAHKEHRLRAERSAYSRLRPLQGSQIPVCVGHFKPRIRYWYHGDLMTDMMILSWSGIRAHSLVNEENSSFFDTERRRLAKVLRSYGVVHEDDEWRNILWDENSGRIVMIDFEEVSWLKKRLPLESTSGNLAGKRRISKEETMGAGHANDLGFPGLEESYTG